MFLTRKAYVMFAIAIVLIRASQNCCATARAVKTKELHRDSFRTNEYSAASNVLDVRSFGAKGNGVTDDTNAFEAAWQAVCSKASTKLHVPAAYRFLVGPINFSGPCKSKMIFELYGTIVANLKPKSVGSNLWVWIGFSKLNGISVVGNGVIDGQGAPWWKLSQYDYSESDDYGGSLLTVKPTALSFFGSFDVNVEGITIKNTPQFHLKFDTCTRVQVSGVTISSPENSPNTDGIHVQETSDVEIHHSSIACGDDCVSIQTGSSGIRVHNINCGPGHGISIGGLGKDQSRACVSNVSVYDSNIQDASNGVRIKTWQGGFGLVKDVSFSNIQVSNVRIPIDINQFYCDKTKCQNQSSNVFITGITYEKIIGTYVEEPLYLACSKDVPCTDIKMVDINLKPATTYHKDAFCVNSYGHSTLQCLQPGRPQNDPSHTQSHLDVC